jgi:hypothetical protein
MGLNRFNRRASAASRSFQLLSRPVTGNFGSLLGGR